MPLTQLQTAERIEALDFASGAVIILPVAATEAHGPHLPLSTDCDIAEGHIGALAEYLDPALEIIVLPIERVGASDEHSCFEGTESRSVSDLISRWFDLARKIAARGGRRLVIVSSHGGNTSAVDSVILKARAELDMLAVGTAWMRFGFPDGLYSAHEKAFGIHGGAIETSLMLHYRPDLVVRDAIANFPSRLEPLQAERQYLSAYGPHRFGWLSNDLNTQGVVGDASAASAEKGAAHADHILRGFAGLLGEVATFDLDWLAQGEKR